VIIGSPDSPQSWNRYASCLNNPVNRVDLNGLEVYFLGPCSNELESMVNRLESASVTIRNTLAGYRGHSNPDLTFTTENHLSDPGDQRDAEGEFHLLFLPADTLNHSGTGLTGILNPDRKNRIRPTKELP
jgi:hypothetical protein